MNLPSIVNKNKVLPIETRYPNLCKNVLTVRSLDHLMKAMKWEKKPILNDTLLHDFDYLEDLNDRRIRDAEVLMATCANNDGSPILEIGTFRGRTTASISENAPSSKIYTLNILEEEIVDGGKHVTGGLSKDEIGEVYKQKGCTNVEQIYANTATWKPQIETVKVAFIDGCHDADFVINDTKKILSVCEKGSIILWHDFNPSLANTYNWIGTVCEGVEKLYQQRVLHGKILQLQDSWIGLYIVP